MIITDSMTVEWPKDEVFVWIMVGKQPMFAFDGANLDFVEAANMAIEFAGKKHQLHLFHQISGIGGGHNEVGFHGWETWSDKQASDLDTVIPEINTMISEIRTRWKERMEE